MKRLVLALCTGSLLLGLAPAWALASTFTVDQSNPTADVNVMDSAIDAQTFTAGKYGPLDSVDLYLDSSVATVTVSLEGTAGNPPVPNDLVLATTHHPVSTPSGAAWVRFDFSTGPIVIPGHVYAIIIYATDNAQVWGSTANVYPRGRALTLYNLAWAPEQSRYSWGPADWAFKTNVGLAAPTPTPTHAPTRAPISTATPTHAPTATLTATQTPTETPTAAPVATESSAATEAAMAAATTPPASGSGSGSGSGSSDSSGSTAPIIAGLIVVLALLAGGLGFLLMRRRRARG
jgi:LPXTG-motif cell wall-anchored protein